MTLGEILKKARRDRSYREMERITGISHVYYITLEKGANPRNGKPPTPSIETLQTLSKTLNIDFGQLLESVGVQLIKELREENKCLREALEEIKNHYPVGTVSHWGIEYAKLQKIAHQALEESDNELK